MKRQAIVNTNDFLWILRNNFCKTWITFRRFFSQEIAFIKICPMFGIFAGRQCFNAESYIGTDILPMLGNLRKYNNINMTLSNSRRGYQYYLTTKHKMTKLSLDTRYGGYHYEYKTVTLPSLNRQISQRIRQMSHIAPSCNRHVHISVTKWCFV